jgi:hypothetical protein
MKSLLIKFAALSLFIALSSFGLVEYHTFKTKVNIIQTDSTAKLNPNQANKTPYIVSEKNNEGNSSKESEESKFSLDDLAKYLIVGIKTVITACVKIVQSF